MKISRPTSTFVSEDDFLSDSLYTEQTKQICSSSSKSNESSVCCHLPTEVSAEFEVLFSFSPPDYLPCILFAASSLFPFFSSSLLFHHPSPSSSLSHQAGMQKCDFGNKQEATLYIDLSVKLVLREHSNDVKFSPVPPGWYSKAQ